MEDINLKGVYLGIVEDIDDPLKIGRCKIRIGWLHGDIPIDDIPWCQQKYPPFFGKGGQCGALSVPKKNAILEVTFSEGNPYAPEFSIMQELGDDVKEQLQKEYEGSHIIGFDGDEDLKMYFTKGKGLTFYYKKSYINIATDNSITIEHADTTSIIELRGGTITINSDSEINLTSGTRIKDSSQECWVDGKSTKLGHQPQYSSVLGEPLFSLLKIMASAIDAKMYPTPGVMGNAVEASKKVALSSTVKVSM